MDDSALWQELLDRRGQGVRPSAGWVYAVQTTGIYCALGCPSPLPRRENVRFFTTGAEAAAAGYRPCKRCAGGVAG